MRSFALALTLACASVSQLSAQTAMDFIGTWDLVRTESLDDSGTWVTSTTRETRHGIIMYDGESTMSVHIVRRDRGTEDTSSGIGNGYMAYYGRYEVDPANRLVTHLREDHIDPNRATEEAVRGFEFEGDRLILTVEPQRRNRLIWQRRH